MGLYDIGRVRPDLKAIGKANNVLLEGGGIGVLRDESAPSSHRYVAFGPGCYTSSAGRLRWVEMEGSRVLHRPNECREDLAFSKDGFTYTDARAIPWPAPQRYDCHNNLWHERLATGERAWLATTRDGFSRPPGRTIGIAPSMDDSLVFNTTTAPVNTLRGTTASQLYSQITFQWAGIYLGIVMVYEVRGSRSLSALRFSTLRAPR